MIKLTRTAWKTYIVLIIANLMIIVAALQTYHYYAKSKNPPIPPDMVRNLVILVDKLQKHPQDDWPYILQRHHVTTNMSLTIKPVYEQSAFLALNPFMVFNALKHNKPLEMSVFVQKNVWLNLSMMPPISVKWYVFISLSILLLIVFLIVNFLVIKRLSQPIETIIQSLEDTELQENWTPIPLTGTFEQQAILQGINKLQKKVHKLLANRTHVVAAISHDLRTPLTRLKLRAENLPEDKNAGKIMDDINEMDLMIRDTLNYFQDLHHVEHSQPFDLVAMIHSINEDVLESGEHISFSTNMDKLVYIGSVNLLKRAFVNLINNAIFYGGSAKINLRHDQHRIEISISDKGPGLSEDELLNVFSPFYRGEPSRSRQTGGTGLGLTIAKEIIEMHQGCLTMKNLHQGGLHVMISLPMQQG